MEFTGECQREPVNLLLFARGFQRAAVLLQAHGGLSCGSFRSPQVLQVQRGCGDQPAALCSQLLPPDFGGGSTRFGRREHRRAALALTLSRVPLGLG
ncbi:hypothetical protein D3C80_2000390 [compost metagenome]